MSDEEMALNATAAPATPVEAEAIPEAGPSTAPEGEAPLSKKAQKRAAKRAKYEATKGERRTAERARRRDRAHFLSEGYAAGTLSAEDAALYEKQRTLKRARKTPKGEVHPAAVIVDLGFDGLMTEQEITSMHSQLGYVYSSNRTAARPFAAVLHTSFGPVESPRLWTKMGKAQWHRWNRMWFTSAGVGEVARELGAGGEAKPDGAAEASAQPAPTGIETAPATTYPELVQHLSPALPPGLPPTHKLVYLSADAEEELTTLAEDEVYVIGGIVDRNRHKMLCQNKAEALGIRTARLPIGTYLANLPTRKVLTVNQVFEILSQYLALQDWAAAFEAVIPQRKYFSGKEEKKKANKGEEGRSEGEGAGEDGEDGEEAEAETVEDEDAQVELEGEAEAEDVAMLEEEAMNA